MDEHPDQLIQLLSPTDGGAEVSLVWLLVACVALLIGHIMVRAAPAVWRFGFDPRRALGYRGRAVRSLGFALLLLLAGGWLLQSLPLAVGVVALLAVVFLFAVTGTLQDALGGAYGQFRLRLREGDRLKVAGYEGEVRTLHWEHLALRTPSGEAVHLPNRVLLREPVTVQATRSAEPLTTRVPVERPDAVDLGRLRDALSLSPYRASGTPLGVAQVEGGIEVRFYLWSREARELAIEQLHALIAQHQQAPADRQAALEAATSAQKSAR